MKYIAIFVIALGLAIFATIPKLYKMCQIRGWLPGATVVTETVSQKWHETPEAHNRYREVYWISWSDVDIQRIGTHRTNVTADRWNALNVGG